MTAVIPFPSQAPTIDRDALAVAFLRRVLPDEGVYCAAIKTKRGGFRNVFHETVEGLWGCLREADRDGNEAYFAVASFKSNASREAENVRALRGFRLDIDYGSEGHKNPTYATEQEAVVAARKFFVETSLPTPMLIKSGGGLHCYWPLKEALTPEAWKRCAEELKAACIEGGLKAGHEITADAARILRAPFTTNRKLPGKPRPVELDPRNLEIEPYELEEFAAPLRRHQPVDANRAGKSARRPMFGPLPDSLKTLARLRLNERALNGLSHPADAEAIADQCAQLGEMRATRGVMPEPTWHACIGVLAFCKGAERLTHEWSKGDERYDPRETQVKFDRCAALTGPTTCERFQGLDDTTRARCAACPHKGEITSPIVLGMRANGETAGAIFEDRPSKGTPVLFPDCYERGKPKPRSYPNTAKAIEALGIAGRHDAFHDKKLIEGDLPENARGELSDPAVRAVREMIVSRFSFDPGKENVQEALERLCEKSRFDPVCDYFDSLKWDGVKRLDGWLNAYLGAEDTPLNCAFARKTPVATVRRARRPGWKFDTMLVLEGPQGAGKSTAIRILAGDENFSDQPIRWDDPKQQQEAVRGVLIHEIGELAGLKKAEVEAVKAFLSRQSDRCRPAYGRYVEDRPRRCIFIGTTNNGEGLGYLTDPSGARRFWPVAIGHINLEALKRDRDQLWAEAAMAEATGEALSLPQELYSAARVEQEKRRSPDPWTDTLAGVSGEMTDTTDGPVERISSVELLEAHLKIATANMTRGMSQRLAAVMNALGWTGPKDIRVTIKSFSISGKDRKGTRVVKGYERLAKA